jgi:hypothetical protein
MRQIALAIHNFESQHGHFPNDQIVKTKEGRKLRHSWRVELLPFLDQQALYDKYDFNEQWNGPNNSRLATNPWPEWNCPAHETGNKTPFKVVTGLGTAFEVGVAKTFEHVTDGSSNTIFLLEDTANPTQWMKPSDLTVDEAVEILNGKDPKNCAHIVETRYQRIFIGSNYARLDGSAGIWQPDKQRILLPGAFLIDDGIPAGSEHLEAASRKEIKYSGYFRFGAYAFLISLPAFYLSKRSALAKPTRLK